MAFGTTRTKWSIWKLEGLASSATDEQVDNVMCTASVGLVLGLM